MLPGQSRQLVKRLLFLSRIKLVYDRITLTRYTTLYFFFTLFSCLLVSALQGVLFADNAQGVRILADVVHQADVPPHLTILMDGHLQVCESIPDRHSSNCSIVLDLDGEFHGSLARRLVEGPVALRDDDDDDEDKDEEDESAGYDSESYDEKAEREREKVKAEKDKYYSDHDAPTLTYGAATSSPTLLPNPPPILESYTIDLNQTSGSSHALTCIYSLSWLEDNLHDSQREDIATVFFQLWLFTIGLVAILNESLPHLGAAFFGHILGGAWSASRIQSTRTLVTFYRNTIVPGPCEGVDFLGSWWESRLVHTIPVVALNGASVLGLGFFSWKLLKVYTDTPFSRVGASPAIHSMYKLVLFFSVGLQLASFFTLVSTGLWISKIAHGDISLFAKHRTLYYAMFIVITVIQLPWLVLGWICVRRECAIRFVVFLLVSMLLIAISSVMFSSNLYRYIFMTCQFFATVTVTAFVFLVITTAFGIICKFNYGKGLKHFLEVTETLEGEDFTPVYFPRKDDSKGGELTSQYTDEKKINYDLERAAPTSGKAKLSYATLAKNKRGSSVYSDNLDSPIIMSSSPPLISDLASPTSRTMKRITKTFRKKSKFYAESESGLSTTTEGSAASTIGGVSAPTHAGSVRSLVRPPPAVANVTRLPSFGAVSRFQPFPSGSPGLPSTVRVPSGAVPSLNARPKTNIPPIEELPTVPTRF